MKITSLKFDSLSREAREAKLAEGDGCLGFRIEDVLPGYTVVGVYFYPALQEIRLHVEK